MTKKHLYFLTVALSVLTIANISYATTTTTAPEISVTGQLGTNVKKGEEVDVAVNGVLINLQGELNTTLQAEVDIQIDDTNDATIEEAYLSTTDVVKMLLDNRIPLPSFLRNIERPIQGTFGRTHVSIGKTNDVHEWSLPYNEGPQLYSLYGDKSLKGDGAEISFDIQLPFKKYMPYNTHLTVGLFDNNADSAIYKTPLINLRMAGVADLPTGVPLGIGVSSLFGKPGGSNADSDGNGLNDSGARLVGLDLSYNQEIAGQDFSVVFEYFRQSYEAMVGPTTLEKRRPSLYYAFAEYEFSEGYKVGLLLDSYKSDTDSDNSEDSSTSIIVTRYLAETTTARLQYRVGDDDESEVTLAVRFGLGLNSLQ